MFVWFDALAYIGTKGLLLSATMERESTYT